MTMTGPSGLIILSISIGDYNPTLLRTAHADNVRAQGQRLLCSKVANASTGDCLTTF